ncbi:ribbon-helix-helix protein, CopG family [Microvirga arsenatis]|uniref:Ribbon-helix-helix protein, CopG family n=1 Tax=Microvirga arsenatis TaxID=2692265 RepID=A0ABW9YU51_9HYPH|nr:ribbon-helix-helix protein, CopG family [Microvirga arsenatis]NBJ09336.1 ribbon-helix-helix protein, CopG family [Microvirga arsenatis]NBJ23806.1 ribbon-helix-helix protein, CopG family [Microvirga arsenatis]
MKKDTRTVAVVSLPADLLAVIDQLAAAEMISRSAFIRRAAARAARQEKATV